MSNRNTPQAPSQERNTLPPEQTSSAHADMAAPDGKRQEPIHPDDVDAAGEPLGNRQETKHNPVADSPDDGE